MQTSIRLLDDSDVLEVNGGVGPAVVGVVTRIGAMEATAPVSIWVAANAPWILQKTIEVGQSAPYGRVGSVVNLVQVGSNNWMNSINQRIDQAVQELDGWYRDRFFPGYR